MKQLLIFGAEWCGSCKALKKTLAANPPQGVDIVEIDIDQDPQQAAKYFVRGLPTSVLLEDGVEMNRKVGNMTLNQVNELLK